MEGSGLGYVQRVRASSYFIQVALLTVVITAISFSTINIVKIFATVVITIAIFYCYC